MAEIIPKKSLGQHFLINPQICQKIVSFLGLTEEDQILEIGPGPGALTRYLETSPHKNLLLLEKDRELARARAKESANMNVLIMDALTFPWNRLQNGGQWKIIGNLPYNIASPLIWNIVSQCGGYEKAVFMVQKEVAQRIAAAPGSKIYGALSVWTQCHARARLEFTLKPGLFWPPPKVDSAIISLLPYPEMPSSPMALKKLLDICFQNRRKQIGTIFKKYELVKLMDCLQAIGVPESVRPEEISCKQFMVLADFYERECL